MRRALLLGVGAALVCAAPASAANVTITGLPSQTWDAPNVTVDPGDTVTWAFADTTQLHNVAMDGTPTADPDWTSFRIDPAISPPPATFTFKTPGTYPFVCELHRGTMFGTVTVGNPPPVVIPLSQQPLANDAPALPAASETVSVDATKPKLSSVSAKRSGHGAARFRFRVSEESTVDVRLMRGGKVRYRFPVAGKGTLVLKAKKLKAGKYRVEMRAKDIAGNASSLKRVSLTVR